MQEEKKTSPMGPTGVARKTMPTRHVFDKKIPFEYTSWEKTNIRERFERMKQKWNAPLAALGVKLEKQK